MAEFVWAPLSIDAARSLLEPVGRPWWIAGGWAIDLFLGRETRRHADLDIAMLRGDEMALASALPGWDIRIPHDGTLMPWAAQAPLERPYNQFWLRSSGADDAPWEFEVLLEEHQQETWAYRRDTRVTMPLSGFGRTTDDGVAYVTPEVALLYKANRHELDRNAADFESAHRALDDAARVWLRAALDVAYPGHPWQGLL